MAAKLKSPIFPKPVTYFLVSFKEQKKSMITMKAVNAELKCLLLSQTITQLKGSWSFNSLKPVTFYVREILKLNLDVYTFYFIILKKLEPTYNTYYI